MKPLRQRRHDRLLMGSSTRGQMAVDHAVAPFDRVAKEMDAIWGTDRLCGLVAPATAARYGRTLDSLNAAVEAADEFSAADRAEACIRGMRAMDAEARAAGYQPPRSGVIVCEVDGFRFGLLPDDTLWRQAEAEHPGLKIYTLRAIGVMLRDVEQPQAVGYQPMIDVERMRESLSAKDRWGSGRFRDDEIPF